MTEGRVGQNAKATYLKLMVNFLEPVGCFAFTLQSATLRSEIGDAPDVAIDPKQLVMVHNAVFISLQFTT